MHPAWVQTRLYATTLSLASRTTAAGPTPGAVNPMAWPTWSESRLAIVLPGIDGAELGDGDPVAGVDGIRPREIGMHGPRGRQPQHDVDRQPDHRRGDEPDPGEHGDADGELRDRHADAYEPRHMFEHAHQRRRRRRAREPLEL